MGKLAATDRRRLKSLNHSLTLDLVVLHRDYHAVAQAQDIAARWLQEMGLTLKPSKTRIGHTLPYGQEIWTHPFTNSYVRTIHCSWACLPPCYRPYSLS